MATRLVERTGDRDVLRSLSKAVAELAGIEMDHREDVPKVPTGTVRDWRSGVTNSTDLETRLLHGVEQAPRIPRAQANAQ